MKSNEPIDNFSDAIEPSSEIRETETAPALDSQPLVQSESKGIPQERPGSPPVVTRKDLASKPGLDKQKLLLLGGGLLVAILFFVFTALLGKQPKGGRRHAGEHPSLQAGGATKGSVTPLMETVPKQASDDTNGLLSPGDIKRTRNPAVATEPANSSQSAKQAKPNPPSGSSLASVPSFADTQQKWEDPKPYGSTSESSQTQTQQQNLLNEPSLIFVRSQTQTVSGGVSKESSESALQPSLDLEAGSRIMAKLQAQVSSAASDQVVAVVEYTYAIGDKVVIPAGAKVIGKLQQVDRLGDADIKFTEIDLSDSDKVSIDASGRGLDLGPIKGKVFGKNTGKNFLIRTVSGLGSVAAMLVGNNTSSAFSEDDLIRERVAENVGTAGDQHLMSLNANSRIVVAVPADTKIYIVFNKHERATPTLHALQADGQ